MISPAENLPVPATSSACAGLAVPTPILEFIVSMFNSPEAIFRAEVEAGNVQTEGAPAARFRDPAEVKARLPEVRVDNAKFPFVTDQ